jgi:hypothetical protein
MTNKLFYGDNLDVLRDHIASDSVDLIYLDDQIEAFQDEQTWYLGSMSGQRRGAGTILGQRRTSGLTGLGGPSNE